MTDWPDDSSEDRPVGWSDDDEAALAAALWRRLRRDAASAGEPGPMGGEAETLETPEPPDVEELLAYLDGGLEPEHEARLARRLVDDPAAARTLLDLADLDRAAGNPPPPAPDLAARSAWRELRRRLPGGGAATSGRRLWMIAAAALLVVSSALGSWVVVLSQARRQPGPDRQPVADLALVQLAATRDGAAPEVVDLAPGGLLSVVIDPERTCPAYRLLVDGPGEAREPLELRPDAGGRLSLLLPVSPGDYDLRLYGCEPQHLLQEHSLHVLRTSTGG